ncbi:MAG: TraR/DksA C4-type zinc finger protein, partial [Oligoflexia bacterium]|nr:TraR/DksA C4-type zinc finger protein [Oligoflexia bacterium]
SYFQDLLLNQKEKLLASSRRAFLDLKESEDQLSDEADFAVAEINQYMTYKKHSRDRFHLLEIEKALGRIEIGEFGYCEECGESISYDRLKARPFSSLCVDCQEDMEMEQKRLA